MRSLYSCLAAAALIAVTLAIGHFNLLAVSYGGNGPLLAQAGGDDDLEDDEGLPGERPAGESPKKIEEVEVIHRSGARGRQRPCRGR